MSAASSITPDVTTDPVAVARALVPLLAERAAEAERLRRPTDVAMQALSDAGLLRVMFPRRTGGAGSTRSRPIPKPWSGSWERRRWRSTRHGCMSVAPLP